MKTGCAIPELIANETRRLIERNELKGKWGKS